MTRITQLCLAHIHREHRLILFPLRLWRQRLSNESRGGFLEHRLSFTLPPRFHFSAKIFIFLFLPRSINARSSFGLNRGVFLCVLRGCSDWNIAMRRHISSSHLYAPLRRRLSDLISARELKRSMQSLVMAPAQAQG